MTENGKLRVWWIPQIPGESFKVDVKSIGEAVSLLDALAKYDLFLLKHNIRQDYSNAGGLEMFNSKANEWEEWNDDEGNDIDDVMRAMR